MSRLRERGGDRPVILWFRDDLRLGDHRALHAAAATGRPLLCIYVREDVPGLRPPGAAAAWFLHHALAALALALEERALALVLRRGDPRQLIPRLATETEATAVFVTRRFGPAARAVDAPVARALAARGVAWREEGAGILHDPDALLTAAGAPYRRFTPFWRSLQRQLSVRAPAGPPPPDLRAAAVPAGWAAGRGGIADLGLLPVGVDWTGSLAAAWRVDEAEAARLLDAFLGGPLASYADARDRLDVAATSRLSPYLRWGLIAPERVWEAVSAHAVRGLEDAAAARGAEAFLRELDWREFAWHLFHHFPAMREEPPGRESLAAAWRQDPVALAAWRQGRTGYPLVDAAMRQLWAMGWIPNRARMVAASFLTKHLLIEWRAGEAWFWDTLVDADPASNVMNWQWVAGCGADAAPFHRIFNPLLQAERFDPQARYLCRWVPELGGLAPRDAHRPWGRAPGYPDPIVDHGAARGRALAAHRAAARRRAGRS